MYNLPQLVRKIREESGLTQEEFARSLSVSTVLVTMVETGQKGVSKNFIKKLAGKLGVSPNSITPFLFVNKDLKGKSFSKVEKELISIGEKLQTYLIKNRAKKLKKYAETKKPVPANTNKE